MEVKLAHVYKNFQKQQIFEDLNIAFSKPGFYLLFGKSGSGKTTLLNLLAGYEGFRKGMRTTSKGLTITSIFQHHELFDFMSVEENIKLYNTIYHVTDQEYADKIISMLRIDHILEHDPDEISEGQKQRVCIARGLIQNADMIFCDEPTEALDMGNRKIVLDLLYELSKTKCVIIATHDQSTLCYEDAIVYHLRDRTVCLMEDRKSQPPKEIAASPQINAPDESYLQGLLNQIMFYKRAFYIPVLGFMTCMLLVLNLYNSATFLRKVSISQDQIFIQVYDQEGFEKQKNYFEAILPVPEFTAVNASYLTLHPDTYLVDQPIGTNQALDQGVLPIMINDALSDNISKNLNIDTCIGASMVIEYKIGKAYGQLVGKITDVVEDSSGIEALYYNEEQLVQILKIIPMQEHTAYEELVMNGTDYIGKLKGDDVITTYQKLRSLNELSVMNREMEQYQKELEIKGPYQMIYFLLEGILGCALIIFVLYENHQITKRIATDLAILSTMNISLQKVKRMIHKQLAKRLIIVGNYNIVVAAVGTVFLNLSVSALMTSIGMLFAVFIFFVITWKLFDSSFRQIEVSNMMKHTEH